MNHCVLAYCSQIFVGLLYSVLSYQHAILSPCSMTCSQTLTNLQRYGSFKLLQHLQYTSIQRSFIGLKSIRLVSALANELAKNYKVESKSLFILNNSRKVMVRIDESFSVIHTLCRNKITNILFGLETKNKMLHTRPIA